jgi:predicted 3-demethylubiquinone-9 3-methyltransferase (glyoxalase superfamily)
MQKLTPFLWFDGNAEEAVNFYVSVFKDSKILGITRWGDTGPGPKGSVLTIKFELFGQEFAALNGGPEFKFTPAVSFVVNCKTQEEIDEYWGKLLQGGKPMECGWLQDKYGLSWQITPTILPELLQDKDQEKADRVMQAMMKMVKIDIETIKQAAATSKA